MGKAKCSETKNCERCGKVISITTNATKYCDCCRRIATTEKHKKLMQRYKSNNRRKLKTLEEINRAAINAGMSYGQYVAMMRL